MTSTTPRNAATLAAALSSPKVFKPNPKPSAKKAATKAPKAPKAAKASTTATDAPKPTKHRIREVPGQTVPAGKPDPKTAPAPKMPKAKAAVVAGVTADAKPNKGKIIAALVTRPQGATMEEMMEAAGWQAHSVRGFLAAGIKKQGLQVTSAKVDGVRVYKATVITSAGDTTEEPI